ncbi:MAG: M50 family metallopeptidase [Endomicrobia bacterium]|nr:M50 family metallopeptidase [Endomicrobiia bacterium]MCL2799685.1 M50 family metallopeptidase [Endomicrobiia bacterium]
MVKIIRNITALFFIPAVAAAAYTLIKSFLSFSAASGNRHMPFWAGIFCYILFQIAFYKPLRTYIFGHELSHAVAGLLSGARIKRFNVGKQSGSVVLTKDNIWITLAPYMFPIYVFALIIIYIMLGWIADIRLFYGYFLFLTGFFIAFHVALTIYILGIGQPDLKVYGVFFSYVVIAAVNVLVFGLLMALAFPEEINIWELATESCRNILSFYKFICMGAAEIWLAFQKTS